MHFSQTFAAAAVLALGPMTVLAGFPVATVEFQTWESCDVGAPAIGEPKSTRQVSVTSLTCGHTSVDRDWSVNNYSFSAHLIGDDSGCCSSVSVWNNDDCSDEPVYELPFEHGPFAEPQCLPEFLEPGFVSFKLNCFEFPGEE
ncbi:hypothetical protein N7474_002188 [Penicillium riverlandense]|uniref:uncharacterized protein n=1 Tax=Penicillium riverlandense TaxID=1903569 RepID=UPI0025494FB6|nr:uncharacterized protein N7474_002188 [Penicillium riverlandense]KAJ5833877.1 hypothetical protein N7474_002188 [Penicillium riverlandense]